MCSIRTHPFFLSRLLLYNSNVFKLSEHNALMMRSRGPNGEVTRP